MNKKCLVIASTASMIGQFNMPNIDLLLSMGYSVTVAANFSFGNTFSDDDADDLRDELEAKGVEVRNIKFVRNVFSLKNIVVYKQVQDLINENNYSLIHCHTPIGGVITRLAAKKHRKNGVRVIYTAHGFHFYKGAPILNWLLYYPVEKWLSRYTDTLITINNEDYEIANKKMNAGETYHIHGIGIDTNKFASPAVDRKTKREQLGIPQDSTVVISIGELIKRKNHQAAIRAISKIKSDNVYYIICGQGKLKNELVNLCQELGIKNRVLFLGYRNDIADLLHMSDIFVFPSLQEGLPVALMEALTAGLPCVASKIRGSTDLIEYAERGYFCDNNSAEEYQAVIENIMVDYNNGIDTHDRNVMIKFDISAILNQIKEIYSDRNLLPIFNEIKLRKGTAYNEARELSRVGDVYI